MKKTVLTIAMISIAAGGVFAQRSNIIDANAYLRDNNYKKAMSAIDAAVVHEKTSTSADAWTTRGKIYLQVAQDTVNKVTGADEESYRSFMKALELKSDIAPAEINNYMYVLAYVKFQKGNAAYGAGDFNTAYDHFTKAVNLYSVNGGKRFADNKDFRNLAMLAKSNAAYAAFNLKGSKDDDAMRLFREAIAMNEKPEAEPYMFMNQILERQHKDDERLALLAEAQKKFPDNKEFRNLELNYYINAGKTDVLLPKLEAAANQDPTNAELWFNLGNSYAGAAMPKDATGKMLPKPANSAELFAKAEESYKKALAIQPENPDYNYNTGVLYYGVAAAINTEMNEIKGMSAAETKKYNALQTRRKDAFSQAQPFFEKSYTVLDAKGAPAMSPEEKITYSNAIRGLMEVYSRNDNKAKTDEMRKKLEALK